MSTATSASVPPHEADPTAGFHWDPPAPSPARERSLVISAPPSIADVDSRRTTILVIAWILVGVIGMAVVLYGLGPLFQQRDQRQLLDDYRGAIERSSYEASGLEGVQTPTKAAELGAPVGIIELGNVQLQQVVVEGVNPSVTATGPGHVPGTSGLGQPGNAVIVGRSGTYGGPFGNLASATVGSTIVVSTTQGTSLYRVTNVDQRILKAPGASTEDEAGNVGGGLDSSGTLEDYAAEPAADEDPTLARDVEIDTLYGPTKDDRLTLVTSASTLPTNGSEATVLIAKMEGVPYAPSPQNGRTDSQIGTTGDSSALPALALILMAYAATIAAAIALYRRVSPGVAYLLTIPPLLCFTVLAAETVVRLLPGWV